jgi:hypothetical protein
MGSFVIREYQESDIKGILALFRISFEKEASEKWFRWKYQHAPWGSRGYVALDDGLVIAFYGGIRLPFLFKDMKAWAYQFTDVMSHPDHRARLVSKAPLIVRMGQRFYRDNPMDFAFGFPSLRHSRLQSLRLGGQGHRLIRVYKKERLHKHTTFWSLKVREGWDFLEKAGGGLKNYGSLQFMRDIPYLAWRYRDNPAKQYRLMVFKRLHSIKGCMICTTENDWVHILEIFYQEEKHFRDLMLALETYLSGNEPPGKGIRIWVHPEEPVIGYMHALGYQGEDGIPLAFKPVNRESGITSDIFYDGFFYRMGDYDAS